MLGSGGFIVMDHTTSIVMNLHTFARFYHHESCGQCSPCREGTGWMEKILHKIIAGHGSLADIDLLWDIQAGMKERPFPHWEMQQHGRLPVPSDIFDRIWGLYQNPKSATKIQSLSGKVQKSQNAGTTLNWNHMPEITIDGKKLNSPKVWPYWRLPDLLRWSCATYHVLLFKTQRYGWVLQNLYCKKWITNPLKIHVVCLKPVASCRTLAQDGMVVRNQTSPEIQEARAGIVEFLLINHPLDCPVCDQAGECSLQDLGYEYGRLNTRYEFERREFGKRDIGDKIKLHTWIVASCVIAV